MKTATFLPFYLSLGIVYFEYFAIKKAPMKLNIILKHFCYFQSDTIRLNQRFSITAQLLVLYYVLSYEEALLANTKTLGKLCVGECV